MTRCAILPNCFQVGWQLLIRDLWQAKAHQKRFAQDSFKVICAIGVSISCVTWTHDSGVKYPSVQKNLTEESSKNWTWEHVYILYACKYILMYVYNEQWARHMFLKSMKFDKMVANHYVRTKFFHIETCNNYGILVWWYRVSRSAIKYPKQGLSD